MGLLRSRRAASPAASGLDQHRDVLLTATTIYRPPAIRAPARRTPPPALPSPQRLALPAAEPSIPPRPTQAQRPSPQPRHRIHHPGDAHPETTAETTAPLPVDPPAAPSEPNPRGEETRGRRRPGADEQPAADWQAPPPRRPRAIGGGRHAKPEPEPKPGDEPVQDGEAASLAAAFALDLASWDEDHPQRRAAVLARYLPDAEVDQLWWDGTGRQRADTALPGRVDRLDDTHVVVDVRVRVTPFVRVTAIVRPLHPPPEHSPTGGAVPAVAPAPEAPGWASCDAEWTRLRIPISRNEAGGLVVTLDSPSRARGTG